MKAFFASLALTFVAALGTALADPAPAAPWVQAQAALDAAMPDIQRSGIRGVESHVAAFEQALTAADTPYQDPAHPDRVTMLFDGPADEAAARQAASHAFPGKEVIFVSDPYAPMAFYLACYYNEITRHADALRIFLAQKARTTGTFGTYAAMLASEHGVALAMLHRLDEALAAYDEGLTISNIDDRGRARMQRGRGYVFTEQNRLDDAEAAYQESLRLEPGNRVALGELQYLAHIRAGGQRTQGGVILNQQQTTPKGSQPDAQPPNKH
jgi:tetratricopeptide (TPR) repeat protein